MELCLFIIGANESVVISPFKFKYCEKLKTLIAIQWLIKNVLIKHNFILMFGLDPTKKFQCFMKEISYNITLLTCKIQQRKVKFSS